ncbi:hypothetical protein Bwad003_12470 [Bilophila wadsworthia]
MLTYKVGKGFQNFSIYSGAVVFISLHFQQYLSIIIPPDMDGSGAFHTRRTGMRTSATFLHFFRLQ